MKSKIIINPGGKSIDKVCRNREEFLNELRVYKLRLEFLPQLKGFNEEKNIIKLKKIEGKTLSTETELDPAEFAGMFSALHAATHISDKNHNKNDHVICQIDTNPRNYLIREYDRKCFMIDFSESDYSVPEHDLVNFLLFWAACYEPERFRYFLRKFLSNYKNKYLVCANRLPLIQRWIDIFDYRREKYCKNPYIVKEWQDKNRQLIRSMYSYML